VEVLNSPLPGPQLLFGSSERVRGSFLMEMEAAND